MQSLPPFTSHCRAGGEHRPLRLQASEACPLALELVTPGGLPVADAELRLVHSARLDGALAVARTGSDGRTTAWLGCGKQSLDVAVRGWILQADSCSPDDAGGACVDPRAGGVTRLTLSPTVVLEAAVANADGRPLDQATVRAVAADRRWASAAPSVEGIAQLQVPADASRFVTTARRGGFATRWGLAGDPDGPTRHEDRWTWPVTLSPPRGIEVRCEGFAWDRCPAMAISIQPIAGGPPDLCKHAEFGALCPPVRGDAVVAAGGRRTTIPSSQTTATLDFRGVTGAIRGMALPSCHAALTPWGADSSEARWTRCDRDGSFAFERVPPGPWSLAVDDELRRVEVGSEPVELGSH